MEKRLSTLPYIDILLVLHPPPPSPCPREQEETIIQVVVL